MRRINVRQAFVKPIGWLVLPSDGSLETLLTHPIVPKGYLRCKDSVRMGAYINKKN